MRERRGRKVDEAFPGAERLREYSRKLGASPMFADLMGLSMSAARQPWQDGARLGAEAHPVTCGAKARTFVRREKHASPLSLSAGVPAEEALRSMLAAWSWICRYVGKDRASCDPRPITLLGMFQRWQPSHATLVSDVVYEIDCESCAGEAPGSFYGAVARLTALRDDCGGHFRRDKFSKALEIDG